MKKICLLLSMLLLTASVYAAPSAKELFDDFDITHNPFSDTDTCPWAEEAIAHLYKNGMISGVGDGKFAPDLNVTRLEFIKMAVSSAAIVDKTAEANYEFIESKEHWGYIYAASAKKAGLIDIYNEPDMGAYTDISREDMAYIAFKTIRLFDESEIKLNDEKFADDAEIADYAKEAVYYLKDLGIINGRGDNLFEPKGTATRAEAAKIIYNVLIKVNENYLK